MTERERKAKEREETAAKRVAEKQAREEERQKQMAQREAAKLAAVAQRERVRIACIRPHTFYPPNNTRVSMQRIVRVVPYAARQRLCCIIRRTMEGSRLVHGVCGT